MGCANDVFPTAAAVDSVAENRARSTGNGCRL